MKIIGFLSVLIVCLIACKHEPFPSIDVTGSMELADYECDSDTIYFQNTILPMLISNCSTSGCHDLATAQDDVVLINYDLIIATGDIEPGNPEDSEIYESITEADPDDFMPPAPNVPLTQTQIDMIYDWIDQGALNNSCEGCDTSQFTYTLSIKPLIDLKCKGCHSGVEPEADFNLITYDDISMISMNGILLDVLNHGEGDFADMPPNGGQLADCEIEQITKWIEAGALED